MTRNLRVVQFSQEGAHGAVAQLVIGPSTAKAVKAAVDTIVSHVDALKHEGTVAPEDYV